MKKKAFTFLLSIMFLSSCDRFRGPLSVTVIVNPPTSSLVYSTPTQMITNTSTPEPTYTPSPTSTPLITNTSTPEPTYTPSPTSTPLFSFHDDFNGALNPRWHWVREDSTHWSLSENLGFLRITTQTGGLYGSLNNQHNILLTDAPYVNYQITTKVSINPARNYQFASLYVMVDDDNLIDLNRSYVGGGTVYFGMGFGGDDVNLRMEVIATTIYLRIKKQMNTYTGYYSFDGISWNRAGQFTASWVAQKVGIGAANNLSGVSEIPADFDYFTLQELP